MKYLFLFAAGTMLAVAFACSDSAPTTPSTPPAAFDKTSAPTNTLAVLGDSRKATSCGLADKLAMRFSDPGFIAGTHVGMYLNFEGLPEGEKTLRIWWDYDNNPDQHQDISLASDTDIEFNPPIEHVYHGAKNGDEFKVRILVMASASTADCSRVRTITLEGGDVPETGGGPTGPCGGDGKCTVFITSTLYNGNLGGLSGADGKCQALAAGAGLSGSYKAWLSDSGSSPSQRFTKTNLPYVRVDDTPVASDWIDLTDGTLAVPINVTQSNVVLGGKPITLTDTNPDGSTFTPAGGNHCGDWTSALPGIVSGGLALSAAANWTFQGYDSCDRTIWQLYCFEQ